ncbi:MAG TPA: tyrosine-type recombinase/integrase [Hyphomicrobium sp.]|nr:tyrosine-type recombinase/integrase [Hyphomicrobium sp.]
MPKLTNKLIERTVNKGEATTLWDQSLRGFAFRLSPNGKAVWLIKRRLGEGGRNAKQVLFVFGEYPVMDLDDATTEAHKLIASIAAGINPQNEKRKKKNKQHEAYANGKLKDVYTQWYAKHRADDWETPGTYWYEVGRRFNVEVLPKLRDQTLVSDISKSDITTLIDNKERITKSGARQVFNAIRPFFKWCASRELIPFDPMDGMTPPEPSEARERILNPDELAQVWEALDHTGLPYGAFYKLLILTLQRRDEVAGMQWCELNHRTKEWIIPGSRTKNGREHLVHLSPLAWETIEDVAASAPRIGEGRFRYAHIFPSTETTYISAFSDAKHDLDETIKEIFGSKLEPWRVHDLRRTGATGLASLGIAPHIVERVLNHISGSAAAKATGIDAALVRVYQRFQYAEERKQALLTWSSYIDRLRQGVTPELQFDSLLALPKPSDS